MIATETHRTNFHNFNPKVLREQVRKEFDTSAWRSVTAVTLTLKQAYKADNGEWVYATAEICTKTFASFMHKLNRAVFGNAACRFGKRLRVLPVVEKSADGRWHIHAAVEPPAHITAEQFENEIRYCWTKKTDLGYRQIDIQPNANGGWIDYMLKARQKSGLETWEDCIDWYSFHNPIADG